MNTYRIFAASMVLLAVSTPLLFAQPGLTKQRVSLYALSIPSDRSSIHLMTQKDVYTKIELSGANTTPLMPVVNSDGTIILYDSPVSGPDGKTSYPVIGTIKASAKWSEVMLILLPDPAKDDKRLSGIAFSMSKKDFPPGVIQFVNFTPFKVKSIVAKEESIFEPNQIAILKIKGEPGAMVNVVFLYQQNDAWNRFIATQWASHTLERTLMFAYQEPGSQIVKSKAIPIQEK